MSVTVFQETGSAPLVSAGDKGKSELRLRIAMAHPGRFRVEAYERDQPVAAVVGDGETIREADYRHGEWTQYPYRWGGPRFTAPLLLRDQAGSAPVVFAIARYSQCWVGAESPYADWLHSLLSLADLRARVEHDNGSDDITRYVLCGEKKMQERTMSARMSVVLKFDAKSRLPVREEEQIKGSALLLPIYSSTLKFVYEDVEPDPKVSEGVFRLEVPDDWTFVPPDELKPAPSPLIGRPCPVVKFYRLDGSPVSLAEYQGRTILLVFWATWCIPCKQELDSLRVAKQETAIPQHVEVLPVSVDSSMKSLRSFLARKSLPFATLHDQDGLAEKFFGVNSVPRTIVVDADGIVREVWLGWAGSDQTKQILEALRQAVPGGETP